MKTTTTTNTTFHVGSIVQVGPAFTGKGYTADYLTGRTDRIVRISEAGDLVFGDDEAAHASRCLLISTE